MARVLIVSYRPAPGEYDAVLALLRAQYQRVIDLGIVPRHPPLLARSAVGEITYVATFARPDDVDRCWEDAVFQELDTRLSGIAELIPLRSMCEASASYMDMEAVEADEAMLRTGHFAVGMAYEAAN
jgi:hypothetical protein